MSVSSSNKKLTTEKAAHHGAADSEILAYFSRKKLESLLIISRAFQIITNLSTGISYNTANENDKV